MLTAPPTTAGDRFAAAMDPRLRRRGGVHYTSDPALLKLLRALCLDELRRELHLAGREPAPLLALQQRLAGLHVLDPACGSGHLLAGAYRELRALEHELLLALGGGPSRLRLDHFHGLEIDPAACELASHTLELAAHLADTHHHAAFPRHPAPAPTRPDIHAVNALRVDWSAFLPLTRDTLVIANPPFVGKHLRTPQQRADLLHVAGPLRGAGDLDYAAAFLLKAAAQLERSAARLAFLTTSSLTQGEQVPILWPALRARGLHLHFAHRSFTWDGSAKVHVVVLGLSAAVPTRQLLDDAAGPRPVDNLTPYLAPGPDIIVHKSLTPRPPHPTMRCGSKPSDNGHLLLTPDERRHLLHHEPAAARFLRRFLGADELLHQRERWCLWLADATPEALADLPLVTARVEAVRKFRSSSSAAPTRRAAARPHTFFFTSQPDTDYLAVPEVSSARRDHLPVVFLPPDIIASNKLYIVPGRDLMRLGLLASAMHMTWLRTVGGRLKSDHQYSASMVYNTFPWPDAGPDPAVEHAAQQLLDRRAAHPQRSLAELCDPRRAPADLLAAHAELDRAVDRLYRPARFTDEHERLAHLLARHAATR